MVTRIIFLGFDPPLEKLLGGFLAIAPDIKFFCWPQGTCAFIRMAGIVRGSVGGACINNFTFLLITRGVPVPSSQRRFALSTSLFFNSF